MKKRMEGEGKKSSRVRTFEKWPELARAPWPSCDLSFLSPVHPSYLRCQEGAVAPRSAL